MRLSPGPGSRCRPGPAPVQVQPRSAVAPAPGRSSLARDRSGPAPAALSFTPALPLRPGPGSGRVQRGRAEPGRAAPNRPDQTNLASSRAQPAGSGGVRATRLEPGSAGSATRCQRPPGPGDFRPACSRSVSRGPRPARVRSAAADPTPTSRPGQAVSRVGPAGRAQRSPRQAMPRSTPRQAGHAAVAGGKQAGCPVRRSEPGRRGGKGGPVGPASAGPAPICPPRPAPNAAAPPPALNRPGSAGTLHLTPSAVRASRPVWVCVAGPVPSIIVR